VRSALLATRLGAVTAALVLSSCGGSASSPDRGSGTSSPATLTTSSPTVEQSSGAPVVGSPDHPVAVGAAVAPLPWRTVPGSTKNLVTVGDGWILTVLDGGHAARLQGARPMTIRAEQGFSITDAFLDDAHALVVREDRLAEKPDVATVVDLASGRTTTLDRRSHPPTVVGGTWALGRGSLLHATSGSHRRYCLATVDLATGLGTTGWCAEPRHGFSRATVTASATTMMIFDDHHPSCRTLVEVSGTRIVPLPGVTRCKGWDSSWTATGAVWSVVPKERRIEAAHFYAHTAHGWYDLGPGTSGSLVTCGGSSYFTRDPSSRTDPARLLRWDPDSSSLTVVYQTRGTGNAFLSPARCGGHHLTVTAYAQAGDEQVTTSLG
jgi:hypothetical protein